MFRTSPCWLLLVTLTACSNPETGGLDTAYTSSTSTGDSDESGTLDETETETETETGTDTEGPDGEPLWFVAGGSFESVLLAIDLSDPHDVPEPVYLATGDGIAALFGPTPFGSEAVTHDGSIEQVQLTAEGTLTLLPLASQEGNWISSIWFGDDGANALVSVSPDSLSGANTLLWVRYSQGEISGSFDVTPPKGPTGHVTILDRSPDSRWAAAAVDIQGNGVWDLYLLPIDVDPGASDHVDHLILTGIPPMNIGSFLSLHLDDQRLVYRRESLPMISRPVAVDLATPDGAPVEIGPNLPHTYSITPGADTSRLLVTTGGEPGYRELRLIELDGPTSALPPLTITEANLLALENNSQTHGHGFDALGRIHYVHGDTSSPGATASVGITLVTVSNGAIEQRIELAALPAGATIHDVRFDAQLQLLVYRVQSGSQSWISYIELSEEQPVAIRVDANFEHDEDEPENHASHGWSSDGSRIAVVGVQQGQTSLHVAEIGDASGATVEIELPDVEATAGYIFDHRPSVSPDGQQLMLWYGTQAGRKGLVHAPTDGSAAGQVVLPPQHSLSGGTYLPHTPQ
jgi:hypothetical protein